MLVTAAGIKDNWVREEEQTYLHYLELSFLCDASPFCEGICKNMALQPCYLAGKLWSRL